MDVLWGVLRMNLPRVCAADGDVAMQQAWETWGGFQGEYRRDALSSGILHCGTRRSVVRFSLSSRQCPRHLQHV